MKRLRSKFWTAEAEVGVPVRARLVGGGDGGNADVWRFIVDLDLEQLPMLRACVTGPADGPQQLEIWITGDHEIRGVADVFRQLAHRLNPPAREDN